MIKKAYQPSSELKIHLHSEKQANFREEKPKLMMMKKIPKLDRKVHFSEHNKRNMFSTRMI